jgi:hypothetical protein
MSTLTNPERDRDDDRVFVFNTDAIGYRGMNTAAQDLLAEMREEPCGTYECPAVYAGYQPGSGDDSAGVANTYDKIVKMRLGDGDIERLDDEDILREADAKVAWLDAIAACRSVAETDLVPPQFLRAHLPLKTAVAGEAIARGLGWLGPDEHIDARYVEDVFGHVPTTRAE